MVSGLLNSFTTLPMDGTSAKILPVDTDSTPALSFGEILKLKEKEMEKEVQDSSTAAALTVSPAQFVAMPLPVSVENLEGLESSLQAAPPPLLSSANELSANLPLSSLNPSTVTDQDTSREPASANAFSPQSGRVSNTAAADEEQAGQGEPTALTTGPVESLPFPSRLPSAMNRLSVDTKVEQNKSHTDRSVAEPGRAPSMPLEPVVLRDSERVPAEVDSATVAEAQDIRRPLLTTDPAAKQKVDPNQINAPKPADSIGIRPVLPDKQHTASQLEIQDPITAKLAEEQPLVANGELPNVQAIVTNLARQSAGSDAQPEAVDRAEAKSKAPNPVTNAIPASEEFKVSNQPSSVSAENHLDADQAAQLLSAQEKNLPAFQSEVQPDEGMQDVSETIARAEMPEPIAAAVHRPSLTGDTDPVIIAQATSEPIPLATARDSSQLELDAKEEARFRMERGTVETHPAEGISQEQSQSATSGSPELEADAPANRVEDLQFIPDSSVRGETPTASMDTPTPDRTRSQSPEPAKDLNSVPTSGDVAVQSTQVRPTAEEADYLDEQPSVNGAGSSLESVFNESSRKPVVDRAPAGKATTSTEASVEPVTKDAELSDAVSSQSAEPANEPLPVASMLRQPKQVGGPRRMAREEDSSSAEKAPSVREMRGPAAPADRPAREVQNVDLTPKASVDPLSPSATEIVRQVVRQFHGQVKSGATSMRLELNPKELGTIDVEMVSSSQGVQVTFFAEQASTGKLLEAQMNQLRDSLIESGVQLSGLNISQHNHSGQKGGAFDPSPNFTRYAPSDSPPGQGRARQAAPAVRTLGYSSEVDYLI